MSGLNLDYMDMDKIRKQLWRVMDNHCAVFVDIWETENHSFSLVSVWDEEKNKAMVYVYVSSFEYFESERIEFSDPFELSRAIQIVISKINVTGFSD